MPFLNEDVNFFIPFTKSRLPQKIHQFLSYGSSVNYFLRQIVSNIFVRHTVSLGNRVQLRKWKYFFFRHHVQLIRMKWSGHESTTHFHLMPKIRMCGVEPQLPLRLHGKYTFMSLSKLQMTYRRNKISSRPTVSFYALSWVSAARCIIHQPPQTKPRDLSPYFHSTLPPKDFYRNYSRASTHNYAKFLRFHQEPKFVHFT